MRSKRSRRQGKGSCCLRSLLTVIMVIAFGAAVFLFTSCQRAPNKTAIRNVAETSHAVRHSARTEHPNEETQPVKQQDKESTDSAKTEVAVDKPTPTIDGKPKKDVSPSIIDHQDLHDFSRGDSGSPQIALTFDAGASAAPCGKILDTLAKHNVHSTFFLTGKWIKANPALTRRIADEGHEIGNHTFSHKRLTKLKAGEIELEADKTERLVQKETGHSTKPLLRVPYGDRNARVLSVLADLGYRSIYWDIDSWDSVKAGITPDEIEERVLGKVRNGSIILMHCGSQATADALDNLLEKLTAAGYHPVKVSELLN